MRRARLFKNDNGSYDLTFSNVTPAEARELLYGITVSKMPEDLNDQLFDKDNGKPITHLRNPIIIGDI